MPTYPALLFALVVSPLAPFVGEGLFFASLLALAAATDWRALFAERSARLAILASCLCSLGLLARVGSPWGSGRHSFARPVLYPINLLDYLPLVAVVLILGARRFPPRQAKGLLWAVVGTLPLYGFLAVGQRFLNWRGFTQYEILGFPVLRVYLSEVSQGRSDAGLANPNVAGAYMLLAAIATATLILVELRGEGGRGRTLRLAAATASLALGLLLLAWSGSRNAWAVTVVTGALFWALMRLRWRAFIAVMALGASLLTLAAGDFGRSGDLARRVIPEVVWTRVAGAEGSGVSPVSWRTGVFGCGWALSLERPLTGWGIGNMAPECERRLGHRVNHAHNLFLQLSSELGFPLAFLLTALVGYVTVAGFAQATRQTDPEARTVALGLCLMALAVVLLSQISLAVFHSSRTSILFWLGLGVPFSLGSTPPPTPTRRLPASGQPSG